MVPAAPPNGDDFYYGIIHMELAESFHSNDDNDRSNPQHSFCDESDTVTPFLPYFSLSTNNTSTLHPRTCFVKSSVCVVVFVGFLIRDRNHELLPYFVPVRQYSILLKNSQIRKIPCQQHTNIVPMFVSIHSICI
jgi:hypothetical protein